MNDRDLKKNDRLQTPEWVYSRLGKIDLDPCAGIDTCIGSVNWAIERGENGLERNWFGFVFCNPPFSQKEAWAAKMKEHGTGILILPERGSAPWFGPLAAAAGHYWVMGKKINFMGGLSSNNVGSCLFPFGGDAVMRLVKSGLPGHLVEVKTFSARNTEARVVADSQGRRTDAGAPGTNDRRGMGEVQAPRRGSMGAGEDQGGP